MYKHFNHEGGNCSPLIAHWPAGIAKPDRWVRSPIHLMDVMPTLCSVSGGTYPSTFNGHVIMPSPGVSFAPLFSGADSIPERTIFFDHNESSAVRQGDWKLVRGNDRYKHCTWELYNLAEDRCETYDLIAAYPEKVKTLKVAWNEWAQRVGVNSNYKFRKMK